MTNPLLTSFLLPPFSVILPKHVVPAIITAINNCQNTVKEILAQPDSFTWNNCVQPLLEMDDLLNRIWSPVSHLNEVKNSNELRKAYEQSLILLAQYSTWYGQHKGLYEAYTNLRNGHNYRYLNVAQKKTLNNTLRDFKLSGIALTDSKKERYGQIVSRMSELTAIYSNNILDATLGWSKLITDKKMLHGICENTLDIASAYANHRKQEGWLLTLDHPCYLAVITYCDNEKLREEIYRAYNTRASDQGPNAGKWDNTPLMNEILSLRHELAQLLGFRSYAYKSLATKTVKNPKHVLNFLNDLVKRVQLKGQREWVQLCTFAKKHFGRETIEPWDIAYYSEKQKKYLFSVNDEQLRIYFPENKVLNGLFQVIQRIYGITVKERMDIDIWHPDVRFFDFFNENGELYGSCYLDLYVRDNKRSGAWMDNCIGRMRKSDGTLQHPIAYITCNVNPPIGGNPALLTHNEVTTLFHEFGHGLHHILTCIDIYGVSGISGVPWDTIELPSQLMENYCWQREALTLISGHYETDEPIPAELLDNILKAKNYQSALFILRQLELGIFDLRIHDEFQQTQSLHIIEKILSEVNKQVSVIPTVSWKRFPHSFNHIFSGGYAAGYYSYLWANVLSSDAFSRFEKEGIFNRKIGEDFLNTILSRGGSENPIILFTRFRGRKPTIDAMLRHYGIREYES